MFLTLLRSAIRLSAVYLYGCVGETITEKSGNLNLGTPGIMCLGGLGSILGATTYVSIVGEDNIQPFGAAITLILFTVIFACLGGMIYNILTTTLKCNQNVTGLSITTFGIGMLNYFGGRADKAGFTDISNIFKTSFPIGDDPNWFETLFLSYGSLVYLAIVIAIISAIVLKRTRTGLNLRAVGENPATADAASISVTKYKYVATLIGSAIAGLGGLFYLFDQRNGNIEYMISDFGWLAVALVIFTIWRPNWAILGSIIFSLLYLLPQYIGESSTAGKEAIKMVPYLATVVVLIITSIVSRRESQPPAALGLSYFREER